MTRRGWITVALLATLVVSATALWLALPRLARWAVVWQVEARTGRRLTMREFDFDLRAGRLRIAGFRLADRAPGPPLAEFDQLDVRFRPGALLRGHVWIEDVTLYNPRVRVVRTGRGELNISDLLRPAEPRERAAALTLDRLALTGGVVIFEDQTLTPPRTWRADALAIDASDLSTVSPEPRGRGKLTATVAGAPLVVEVSGVRLAPLQGRASLTLRDMDATLANLYLPPDTAVVLERATASAALTATRDAQDGLRLEGQAELSTLVLRRRGVDASLVTVPTLAFALTTVEGPDGRPRGRLEVTGSATVHDPRPGQSHRFDLERLRLVVDGLDASGRAPAKVRLTATLPGGGGLDVQGTARFAPLGSELRARVSRVDLAFWAPYLELPLQLAGMAETDLTVDLAAASPPAPGGVTTRVRGSATLTRATVHGPAAADGRRRLLAADRIEVTGLDAQWPKVRVESLRLARPRVTIERDREGRLPIVALLGSMKSVPASGEKAAATPPAAALALEVGEIVVEEGRVRLDDASVSPPARLRVAPIKLTASDVTWPSRRPARVTLSAVTPQAGTIEAEGTVSLDPVRFDLRARLAGVALTPYRPYVRIPARLRGRLEADLALRGRLGPLELSARGTAALGDLAFMDGDRPILTVGRIEAAGLDYAWPATVAVDRLSMKQSWVDVERRPDGTVPLTQLVRLPRAAPSPAEARESPPESPEIRITVRETVFEDGRATIRDAAVSPSARIEVAGVRLGAQDFAWPARGPIPVQVDMPTPGAGRLTARGQRDLAARTLDLEVAPRGVDMAPLQPYLPVRGRIAGKATGDFQVEAALEPLTITARGAATIADLALADGDRPVATAAQIEATGVEYAWPATVVIESVRLQKPWAEIERGADGSFQIAALLGAGDGRPAGQPAPKAPNTPKADVRVRRAAVEDGVIAIVDSAVSPPARAQLQGLSLQVQNLDWPARGASQVKLRTQTTGGGYVEAQGEVRLDGQGVDMQVAAQQVDLATMQPFLPSRATIEGKLDGDLRIKGTLEPLAVAATGRLAFDDPTFGDGQRMLAYIKRVEVAGLDAEWPRRVTIERVALDKPWTLLERAPDGTVPLLGLFAAGSSSTTRAPDKPSGSAPPVVTVGSLTVEDGFVRFVDHTTRPAFAEEASLIALTGRGLGTGPNGRGEVTLTGQLTGGAPFEIKGPLGPIGGPLDFDLEGKLTDFALPRINPYSSQLIGWVARRGVFGATVRYRVVDNRLEGTNDLFIGQPEYVPSRRGDEVRERVGVPFGLLVSLLKNARGEIHLSVPVSGDLASRQLDLSGAFWEAMRKTAISVVSLPVSWVGKIFYTEDARIETVRIWSVYFEAGTTRFARGFDKHAERLAKFLHDAPGVTLAMKPVLTVADIAALKREAVRQRIEAAAREPGQTAEAAAARLFVERFPDQAPPQGLDALVAELVRAEPNPDAAARSLADRRMETTRNALGAAKGATNAERLRATEGVVPVEGSGLGRIEFEIVP